MRNFVLCALIIGLVLADSSDSSEEDLKFNRNLWQTMNKVMNDKSVSSADKRSNLTETLNNLKGDYKEKWNKAVEKLKDMVEDLKSSSEKKAGERFAEMVENRQVADWYATEQYKYSVEDQAAVDRLAMKINEKFARIFFDLN